MQEKLFKNKYPIFTLSIKKEQSLCGDIDSIIATLKESVDAHGVATYIGIFDHYSHTTSLSEHEIDSQILDAKNILFCFGKELMNPEVLAVRPRSIGVADMGDNFVLSFLEAPNPTANEAMKKWCNSLLK
jgi:hypothetical protein